MKHRTTLYQGIACVIWVIVVGAGMTALVRYANTPGRAASAADRWPDESRLASSANTPTLVMFAHPQCPCSRASVRELAVLMARVQGRVQAHVVFYEPSHATPDWKQAALRRAAAIIPGVRVSSDVEGVEAERFGAFVSGQTFLYGADGRMLFSGGITGARGHSGDNAGRTALTEILMGSRTGRVNTPVFGCALVHSELTGPTTDTTP